MSAQTSITQFLANPLVDARIRTNSASVSSNTTEARSAAKRPADAEDLKEAAKRLCLSAQTKENFQKEFPGIEIPTEFGGLKPHFKIQDDAVEEFFEYWLPQVLVADSVVRYGMGGEKARFMPIFSLLGAVAILGSKKMHLQTVAPRVDAEDAPHSAESPAEEVEVTLTTTDIQQLLRYVGYEESLDRENIEFMMFASATTSKVEGLVEVKAQLPPSTTMLSDPSNHSPVWQFFFEMARSLQRNNTTSPGEIWGALCDVQTWYFGRIVREQNGGAPNLFIHGPLTFQKNRELGKMECTGDTKPTLQFLFSLVHGTELPADHFTKERLEVTVVKIKENADAAICATTKSFRRATYGERMLAHAWKAYVADCSARDAPVVAAEFAAQNDVDLETVTCMLDSK